MKKARKQCNKSRPRRSSQSLSSSAVEKMTTHRRHFRSSLFAECRPEEDIAAVHGKRKRTEYGPRGDTFEHLFGASLSVTGRRISGPNAHRANPPSSSSSSTFPKVMHRNLYYDNNNNDDNNNVSSVLNRPLELSGRSVNDADDRSNDDDDDDAVDCRAAAAAAADRFPYLHRVIRASDGRSLTMNGSTCLSVVAETPRLQDLPKDIYWLGDDPLPPRPFDFHENPTACPAHDQPTFEEASYPAETGQQQQQQQQEQQEVPSFGLASAICWLGDPVLKASQPQPPKTDSCRSRLRSNPFNNNNLLQTTRTSALLPSSCKIRRRQRNIGSTSFL